MSVHAQYMVKCAGGGWLDPGRPLICLGVSCKFASGTAAFYAARSAGWTYETLTHEHHCPNHQTGEGHVHYYREAMASWPEDPDGEIGTIKRCVCGAIHTEPEG